MTFKNPNGNNLSVRVDDQGNVTGNNLEDISIATEFLINAINQ